MLAWRQSLGLLAECPASGDAGSMADNELWATGVFPARFIERLAKRGAIVSAPPFDADQVQPASLDLRLGDVAYRVRSSFLPGPDHTVADRIEALKLHEIDLTNGAVLERGCVYLVPLQESLELPERCQRRRQPQELDRAGSTSSPA